MLTYNSLLEQAKLRGMPQAKTRGILREYLQVLILKELHGLEQGRKLYFTGGTYLRLAHNIKRFSEDLDFNADMISAKEFKSLLEELKKKVGKLGLKSSLELSSWKNIHSAGFTFPGIEKEYGIISPHSKKGGITIKIETNSPRWKIKTETQVISGFGELYPCLCTDKSQLFADKIDALIKKQRGRHIYDIIFMLMNKYPIDKTAARALGIKGDLLGAISGRIKELSKAELKKQAETLRPFLFDEREAELISGAKTIIPGLLKTYGQ